MKWLAAAAVLALARAASPPFSVSVETAWSAPPLVLEILETVHDEDPAAYFPFLRLLAKHIPALDSPTPQSTLEVAHNLLDSHNLLRGPARSTLDLALALHAAAPRITAAYAAYNSSHAEVLGVGECEAWVEIRGKGFCGVEELRKDVERSIEAKEHVTFERVQPGPFDRVSPSVAAEAPSAVLYYSPTADALPLLEYLDEHARAFPSFQYVVRYRPTASAEEERRTPLTGYGVEMALKKTDYLVVDDRIMGSSGQKTFTAAKNNTSSDPFVEMLGEDPWAETAVPLTDEEIPQLGLQAVALIKASDDPLNAFVALSQDLPKYAAALARNVEVPEDILATAMRLSVQHPFGPSFIINGRIIKETELNAFGLLTAIRRERHIMASLMSQGLTAPQALELVSDQVTGTAMTEREAVEGLVDASDRPEGGDVISWLNDIENDAVYARWPAAINGYMRPLYPGQLHLIRRNTWNVIMALDLATPRGIEAVASQAAAMIMRKVPVRIGIVPLFGDKDSDSAKVAKAFNYIANKHGKTREFCNILLASTQGHQPTDTIDLEKVQAAYERFEKTVPFEDTIASPEADATLDKITAYLERVGATAETGSVLINGKYFPFSQQWPHALQSTLTEQLQYLQETIAADYSFDSDSISTFFYDLPSTSPKRNAYIVPEHSFETKVFNLLDVFAGEAGVLARDFVYPPAEDAGTPLTTWIIGDLDSDDGVALVRNALTHIISEAASSRLGFVHIPQDVPKGKGPRLSTLIYQLLDAGALQHTKPEELLAILDEIDTKGNLVDVGKITADSEDNASGDVPLNSFTYSGWTAGDVAKAPGFWRVGSTVASRLGIKDARPHILINGRLIGPVTAAEFSPADFDFLERYEMRKRVMPVINVLHTFIDNPKSYPREALASLISTTSSIVATAYLPHGTEGIFSQPPGPRSRFYEQMDDGEMSFAVGDRETATIHIAVVVDPVAEIAQKWSALAKLATELADVAVSVHFDPNMKAKDFKVKRFYRSALRSSLQFDVDGNEVTPVVTFNDLPGTPIFTLAMHTPGSWIVRPTESPLDLDNLLLGRLSEPTHVGFNLKQLVIHGHARDENGSPPRGTQLQLKAVQTDDVVSDTQVMANLGYFQFKAPPGVYDLAIRPGRGTEVYEIESTGTHGWESDPVNVTGTAITLDSFNGDVIFPRFVHRAGMELADVLAPSAEDYPSFPQQVFSRMKSMLGLTERPASRHADINIFTVASGLLYERFASIMILSVMKHTKSTVKFWFIENFLSPTFINFLPHLAKEYGFDYELVTYKWPEWLRAQTEKQRIIWAYKILFLDVLFPMDLDKVIFVDADQIVRVDMQELVDVDLHGRVYGYPPMGDDRAEMEGFRFWKTGYWKEELRGLPYHISALYVVDLKRFRQRATGDMLRGQYQALSADPNSLANLDQDLPNSMQRQIPIFTLDQEWLWCQTWCSDESLAKAKTIDLCQNPLTKEPKLVRARQIPEWDSYDREIAAFAATLEKDGGALAANVDDLAEGPGAVPNKAKADKSDDKVEGEKDTEESKESKEQHDEL